MREKNEGRPKRKRALSFKTTRAQLLTQSEIISRIAEIERTKKDQEKKKKDRAEARKLKKQKLSDDKENQNPNLPASKHSSFPIKICKTLANGRNCCFKLSV